MILPADFEVRMKRMLGDEWEAFQKSLDEMPENIGVRINPKRAGAREAVLEKIGNADRVAWCPDGYYADKTVLSGRHPYHAAGLFYFQEPSAMAAVEALGAIKPGARVLDLCAAPGGKATQAACKMDGGVLTANEIVPKRAKILAENIARMGITNAVVMNEEPQRLLKKYPEFFDYIILDAPCSGEGMFRKEEQAVREWSTEHSEACAKRQKLIADCAVGMLAGGGKMIYSTCTFAPCENEGVCAYILEKYPEMKLCEINLCGLSDGCGAWAGAGEELSLTKRIFPHKARGEGHFFALFEKCGGGRAQDMVQKGTACREFDEFCKKNLKRRPEGTVCAFGDRIYILPEGINIDKIKVTGAGLFAGEVKKNRFEPSHDLALALCAEDFRAAVNFDAQSEQIERYMHGETIPGDADGWCAVCADGFVLGWAKGVQGVLKNHYPKTLRI